MQRRLWRICTFAQAHLRLRPGTEISCASSNNDLCTVIKTVNAVVRLHQHPQEFYATISALYQCVKKCSQCVVKKFLNKTFASLPRKKPKVVIVFWMLFHGNMTTAALRRTDSTQLWQLHQKKAPVTAKLQNFV